MTTSRGSTSHHLRSGLRRSARGFTLVELLIALIVISLLASIAIPSFRTFVTSQRIKNASFDLMSMIILTRSEAIKRNTNVTLNLDPATGMFTILPAGSTTPIRRQEMFTGFTLNCVNPTTHAVVPCSTSGIVFRNNGRLVSAFGPLQLSDTGVANATATRCISIDLGGRPRSKKGAC